MTFFRSYSPNYFSIQDIMVTQERVPCKTETVIRRLGFLCAEADKEDIEEGVSLELPFWLAHKLHGQRRKIVRSDIPKVYKEKSRDIFEADAKVVHLYKVNPHFYEFGCYLSHLNVNHRENELIQSIIIQVNSCFLMRVRPMVHNCFLGQAFKERFRLVMDWADNVMMEPHKIQLLEVSERDLLKAGQKARMLLNAWLIQGVSQMKPAEMVVNFKKRKFLSLESGEN